VFTAPDGSDLHPDRFSELFIRLAAKAGLPRIRLHDLRHTHATLALRAGEQARVMQERLGHSKVAVTLDTYTHVQPGMQAEAAERVAALVALPER
jgi:integrase